MTKTINSTIFKLIPDRYGGVEIDISSISGSLEDFNRELIKTISEQKNKNLLWITLPIIKSDHIPLLTRHKFTFFDCNETSITLVKKLLVDSAIPTATNHTVGVGAFVMDQNEILVVKDRIFKSFKLPGGFIENNEKLSQALIREVFEETGIKVMPESIVFLGHFSPGQFNESNMYIVCKAKPLSKAISITDNNEVIEAKWVNVHEYLNFEEVHVFNKKIVIAAMQKDGIKIEDDDLALPVNTQYELFF